MLNPIILNEQSLKDRPHDQSENLADTLFYKNPRAETGTPEAERLKKLMELAQAAGQSVVSWPV